MHAPVQFTKMKPASGDADNVTDVFVGTDAEHRLPQLIGAEDVLTTVPLPLIFTCRDALVVVVPPPPVPPPPVPPPPVPPPPLIFAGSATKSACAVSAPRTVTAHVGDVPAATQAPFQPEKIEPLLGLAVSVTTVPASYAEAHLLPHARRRSLESTSPDPVLPIVSVSACTLAAVICALISSPTSSIAGAVHVRSAHNASCVIGS